MATFLTTGALVEEIFDLVTAASTYHLMVTSPTLLRVTGTVGGMTLVLPDATSMAKGMRFVVMNESSVSLVLQDFTNSTSATVYAGNTLTAYLDDASSQAGIWAYTSGGGGASTLTLTAGESISAYRPVCIGTDGFAYNVDISDATKAYATCGLSLSDAISGCTFDAQTSGLVANLPSISDYGAPIFVLWDGTLTEIKPSIENGYDSGDFVIFMGVTKKNDTASIADLILNIKVTGVL